MFTSGFGFSLTLNQCEPVVPGGNDAPATFNVGVSEAFAEPFPGEGAAIDPGVGNSFHNTYICEEV